MAPANAATLLLVRAGRPERWVDKVPVYFGLSVFFPDVGLTPHGEGGSALFSEARCREAGPPAPKLGTF